MFPFCAVSLLVCLSLEGIGAQRQQVSVQLAWNNSGLEAVEGKNRLTVLLCVCVCVCVSVKSFHTFNFSSTASSPYCKCQEWLYFKQATTTALILSIHCFLAYLLSMKGNFNVVISPNHTNSLPFIHFYVMLYFCVWQSEVYSLDIMML